MVEVVVELAVKVLLGGIGEGGLEMVLEEILLGL